MPLTMGLPGLMLGRHVTYSSEVLDGDIDSPAALARLQAALTAAKVFVFNRAYNVTAARASLPQDLFVLPATLWEIEGRDHLPIDMSMMANSGAPKNMFRLQGTAAAARALTADLHPGADTVTVGAAGMVALALQPGDRVTVASDRLFVPGGTVTLLTAGAVTVTNGEVLTQAGTGATLKVQSSSTASGQTTINGAGTGIFNSSGALTGSTSGALGANSIPATITSPEAQGEIATVTSVGNTSFTISPPAQDDYLVADGATVQKLSMPRNVRFNGLRGEGTGQFATDVVGDRMFHVIWAEGLILDGVTSNYFDNGDYFYSCPGGRAEGCTTLRQPLGGRTANSYGMAFVNACHDFVVDRWTGIGGKHAIVQTESHLARGATRRMVISGGFASGQGNYAIATHTNAEDIWILRNRINGSSGGIDAGCRGAKTVENEITFLPDANIGVGISISEVPQKYESRRDKVFGGRFALRLDTTATPPLSGVPSEVRIADFYAEGFSQAGLRLFTALSGAADLVLRGIDTREAGGAASGVNPAPSIRIEGDWSRVEISRANLQAADGNTSAAIVTSGINKGRVSDVLYYRHSAPSLAGTDVISSNLVAF